MSGSLALFFFVLPKFKPKARKQLPEKNNRIICKSKVINLLKVGMSVFTAIMIVIVVLVISCLNILISQKFLVSGINAKYYIPEHQLRLQVCHLCIGSSSCVGNSNLNLVSEPSRPTVACIRETRPNWYCRTGLAASVVVLLPPLVHI